MGTKGSEERVPQVLNIYSSIIQGREDSPVQSGNEELRVELTE